MNIYLLSAPFVVPFIRCGTRQGAAAQSGGLVEQTHGNYVVFMDADYISLKGWFENLVCEFGNDFVGVGGGTKSIVKELWKETILFALDILLRQLDLKKMFIENDTLIFIKYKVPDFFDENKRKKSDPPCSCNARWNTSSLESLETMEIYDRTDSSSENLQTLGLISSFYHKTSARELEV